MLGNFDEKTVKETVNTATSYINGATEVVNDPRVQQVVTDVGTTVLDLVATPAAKAYATKNSVGAFGETAGLLGKAAGLPGVVGSIYEGYNKYQNGTLELAQAAGLASSVVEGVRTVGEIFTSGRKVKHHADNISFLNAETQTTKEEEISEFDFEAEENEIRVAALINSYKLSTNATAKLTKNASVTIEAEEVEVEKEVNQGMKI